MRITSFLRNIKLWGRSRINFVVRELEGMATEIGVSRRVWTLAPLESFTPHKHGFQHSEGQIEEC